MSNVSTAQSQETLVSGVKSWIAQHNLKSKGIALAVSGGADSMALAKAFSNAHPAHLIHAFTVDHGLRHGSAAEARWTCRQLAQMGLACKVLTVSAMGAGNIQAAARMARYHALSDAAASVAAPALCTAHTLDDQAETILARLSRGSGTKGLSGMANLANIPGHSTLFSTKLYRPFLGVKRSALRAYLRKHRQCWAEDPSNSNRDFDRIRLREILRQWQDAGFSIERIVSTGANMRRSDDALEHYAQMAFAAVTKVRSDSSAELSRMAFLTYPEDTQLRLLARCLQTVSGNSAPIRMVKLEACQKRVHTGKKDRFTLHGCVIVVTETTVSCVPEG